VLATKKATDFGISFLNHYFLLIYKRKTNFMAEIIGRVGWRNYVPVNNPLWDNLLAYWSGDNTANDSKGTYNGTLVNGATYSTGKIGSGFSLDGVNDYVDLGNVLNFDGSTPFSVSSWVYTSSGVPQTYFSKIGDGWKGYELSVNLGWGVRFYLSGSIGLIDLTINGQLENEWQHIVFTYDGSKNANGVNGYINGVLRSKNINTNTLTGIVSTTTNAQISGRGGSSQIFNGSIDEVGVWNRAITSAEITELYNAGAGKQYVAPVVSLITTGLVMNLDASNALSYTGTGTSWTDLSGGGNNGTLLNGTSYSSENGGTLVLDGINDYVKINNGTGLNLGNEYTFSIWVKFNNFNAVLAGADMWDYYYLMYVGDSNNIYTSGAGGSGSFSGLNITTNQWVCLTIVRSAASNTLYKNGVYISSGNPSNSGIVKAIGAYASGSFNLNGKISSVNAYNRALSSTEVTQNFNATKTRFGL
jgi:hypothetical protein